MKSAMKRQLLLYIETSIFGFYYDQEPRNALRREAVVALLAQVRTGVLDAFTSPLTLRELGRTHEPIRSDLLRLLAELRRPVLDRQEVETLTEAYLRQGAIPARFADDAEHVAYATAGRADVLVSLNLRHLVNVWAERRIGAVNMREGYQVLRIRTPEEVLKYED